MKYQNNVRSIRKSKGLTLAALAEKANLSESYLSRIESGDRNLSGKTIDVISQALGVDTFRLLSGGDQEQQSSHQYKLPIKGKVAAGLWAEPQEPSFRDDILALPEPALEFQFGLEVSGDSLKDLDCRDGDILHCVSTQAAYPNQGDVVIAESVRGDLYEYTAKILHRNPDGSMELRAANDKYSPIKVAETPSDQEIRVIGVVVRILREMR